MRRKMEQLREELELMEQLKEVHSAGLTIALEGKRVQDTDESVIAAVAALLLHSFIHFPYLLVLHSGV